MDQIALEIALDCHGSISIRNSFKISLRNTFKIAMDQIALEIALDCHGSISLRNSFKISLRNTFKIAMDQLALETPLRLSWINDFGSISHRNLFKMVSLGASWSESTVLSKKDRSGLSMTRVKLAIYYAYWFLIFDSHDRFVDCTLSEN